MMRLAAIPFLPTWSKKGRHIGRFDWSEWSRTGLLELELTVPGADVMVGLKLAGLPNAAPLCYRSHAQRTR